MPESPSGALPPPSDAELAEILAELEFFLAMEDAAVLPLDDDGAELEEAADER